MDDAANQRLRNTGIRISIQRREEGLCLRGILSPKPHSNGVDKDPVEG